jgi:hydrogenase expression/formation protein HypC
MCLAVPGRITEIRGGDPAARTGTVDFGGVAKEINLTFVPEAVEGDYVLVHAGFALNTVDEEEAKKVFEYLREMEELASEENGKNAGPEGSAP